MAFGKSLSLREIKAGAAKLPKLAEDEKVVATDAQRDRRAQRYFRRRNPETTTAFTRRQSSTPTGPGSLTRYHVEVSETPGIAPLYFMARPFPVRRPMDWAAHKAMQKVQIVPDKPQAETLPYAARRRNYQAQSALFTGVERPLTARQRKRLRQKQNAAGLAQRRRFGLQLPAA